MVGGIIVQAVGDRVEVLDNSGRTFDRCWRSLENPNEVREGDSLWWQSFTGYLSRDGEFQDKNIGACKPADPPSRH